MMAKAWIDNADIATALGLMPEAEQQAIRGHQWHQCGNADRALVLVGLEAEKARERRDERRTIEAPESDIALLKATVAMAEALVGKAEAACPQIDGKVADLVAQLQRLGGRDRIRAEFDAYRAPPW